MSRSVAVYVADVLDMMGAAERFVAGMTAEAFAEDERTQLATPSLPGLPLSEPSR